MSKKRMRHSRVPLTIIPGSLSECVSLPAASKEADFHYRCRLTRKWTRVYGSNNSLVDRSRWWPLLQASEIHLSTHSLAHASTSLRHSEM